MAKIRIFKSDDFMRPADGEPVRSVITESEHASVVAWYVMAGQRIAAHVHPDGHDTWTVLSGQGAYQLEAGGKSQTIGTGDVVLARAGCVHGVYNAGTVTLRFISVVCPLAAGYRPVTAP